MSDASVPSQTGIDTQPLLLDTEDKADERLQKLLQSSVPGRGATKAAHWGLLGYDPVFAESPSVVAPSVLRRYGHAQQAAGFREPLDRFAFFQTAQ